MTDCGIKSARDRIMSTTVSPLALKTVPDMPPIGGVRLATAPTGCVFVRESKQRFATVY
jgi:hypothetical protein